MGGEIREELEVAMGEVIEVHVGEFDANKNQLCLHEAWTSEIPETPDASLFLVENGTIRLCTKKWVRIGYSSVLFFEYRRDISRILAMSGLLVAPLRWDAPPGSVMKRAI